MDITDIDDQGQDESTQPQSLTEITETEEKQPTGLFLRQPTEGEQACRKEAWLSMKDEHCAAIERMINGTGGLHGSGAPKVGDVRVTTIVSPPKGVLSEDGKRQWLASFDAMASALRSLIEES
jgi:hypothetical protein